MNIRRAVLEAVAALAVGAIALGAQRPAQPGTTPFPHDTHSRLFLSCASCHAGITDGNAARAFPAPATCARCHNGQDAKTVAWSAPAKKVNNLRFTHPAHDSASSKSVGCVGCHSAQGDTTWMHVRSASPRGCIACHAHAAPEHLAETATCRTCHTTLADSRALTVAMIAAFPKPASHARSDFLSTHAPRGDAALAQCATCHTRESCVRCHANGSQLPSVTRLAADDRVAQMLRGRAATYPTPPSHASAEWSITHGKDAAKSTQSCANCHTQPACRACHAGTRAASVIAALPMPMANGAQGVAIRKTTVHAAGFMEQHKTAAASGRMDCMGCHQKRECSTCHSGTSARRYHPSDFVSRHSPKAYAQQQTCSSCHRTETFCRSCHLQSNITSTGARTGAAHPAQPAWLLQHGEAARRGLNGCTTCHQQRDCLRCHSDLGLKVNPHGPKFEASSMSARNRQMCATCHIKDPLER
jgi:hypothetical protein